LEDDGRECGELRTQRWQNDVAACANVFRQTCDKKCKMTRNKAVLVRKQHQNMCFGRAFAPQNAGLGRESAITDISDRCSLSAFSHGAGPRVAPPPFRYARLGGSARGERPTRKAAGGSWKWLVEVRAPQPMQRKSRKDGAPALLGRSNRQAARHGEVLLTKRIRLE